MRSNILAALTVTTLALGALSACGGEEPPPQAPAASAASAGSARRERGAAGRHDPASAAAKPALADLIPAQLKAMRRGIQRARCAEDGAAVRRRRGGLRPTAAARRTARATSRRG